MIYNLMAFVNDIHHWMHWYIFPIPWNYKAYPIKGVIFTIDIAWNTLSDVKDVVPEAPNGRLIKATVEFPADPNW